MANEDNLKNGKATQFKCGEDAAKKARASAASRRRKRQFRDELEMLLPLTDKGKDGQPIINPLTGRKQTVQQSITMQLLLKARKGDVKAAKLILEVLGERLLRAEETHEVNVTHSRYEGMTEDELIAETKRLNDAIENT